jgi:hypothetical protein
MKKYLFLLWLIVFGINNIGYSQKTLKVSSFRLDPQDITASTLVKNDINGIPCGLIKIGLPLLNATFEGNIISSEYKNGEWWVYMTKGTKMITIKTPNYSPLEYAFGERIQSKMTYVMTIEMPALINAFSYIVPGLGQIELGNKAEGYTTIAGEALLLGGGVISSISANKQLEIMRDVDVSLDDFITAKNKYNTLKAVNVACYVGAAALYGFHLYRVYYLSKKAKTKGFTFLTPTIMTTDESMALGLSININF